MQNLNKSDLLLSQLQQGKLYKLEQLAKLSNSVGRDVKKLVQNGKLQKVGPGMYYYAKKSRFGNTPPDEHAVIKEFLKNQNFLLLHNNWYNALGLGLTQLQNETLVYNTKRYEKVKLCGRTYNFKRPNNGFPKQATREFLLVDLVNNINTIGESSELVKNKISDHLSDFNKDELAKLSALYGKVGTKKFFFNLLGQNNVHS